MVRIEEVKEIHPDSAKKLIAAGIKTTDELIKASKSAKSMLEISKKTGIDPKLILEYAIISDRKLKQSKAEASKRARA